MARPDELGELRAQNATLLERVTVLMAEVAELKRRLGQNSTNSSRPPSSDPPQAPKRAARERSGREPGGQPGHLGRHREMVASPDRTLVHPPERCDGCGAGLAGGEPVGDPVRHQVWELPAAVCLVTEHQRMRVKCACCGKVTLAGVPTGIPAGAFGPNAGWQISTPLTPALGSSSRLISGLVPVHDPLDRIAAVISKRLPVLLGFCLLAFGLAGVGVAATAFGKSPSKRPLCVRYKCTTLAADPQVGVYQAANKHRNREVEYQSSFARWIPSGRVTALGDYCNFECVTLQKLALAGRFLLSAFTEGAERYPGSGVGGGWYLSLLNVQTGRRQKVDPVGGKEGGFGKGSPGVTDVVVTPAGTAAWIIDGEYQNPTGPSLPGNQGELPLGSKSLFELAPGSRTPVVLATSSTIDPTSLAAIPGHLYWIEGGTPRTASIQ